MAASGPLRQVPHRHADATGSRAAKRRRVGKLKVQNGILGKILINECGDVFLIEVTGMAQ
ncbi:hypothetical protein MSHO_00260 [Mycobacterium shottsii]|uniref:Uncharacterized protein n=1 Tax=Mycobacterium shottsii TaxID=133549 RepID=A0A7I7L3Q2_9MYCO|nr:hypothetical protein MSHO_00260 [Mycobacterium shottsii]